MTITGKDFNDCLKKAKAELKRRKINFNSTSIASQIKRQNGFEEGNSTLIKKKLTFVEAVKGAKAVLRSTRSSSCASNQEVLRRASICAACPLRVKISDCMVCGGGAKVTTFANTLQASFGNKVKIPDSVVKNYCDICGCSLATMVVTKYADLTPEPAEKTLKRPAFCWLNPSSNNFTKE